MARQRTDWAAVERDYRTGKFTLRELETKHGASYSQISRKAKQEGWTQDLRDVIRAATNAAVLRETATKAQQDATAVVVAAAEMGKQVILQHRSELREARTVASSLLSELKDAALLDEHRERLAEILAGEGAKPEDVARARTAVARAVGLGSRVSSVKALSEAFTKLHAAERVAFDLEDAPPPNPAEASIAVRFVEPGK